MTSKLNMNNSTTFPDIDERCCLALIVREIFIMNQKQRWWHLEKCRAWTR